MSNKRPAFTLIETVFSVLILLLICQIAVFTLQTGTTLTDKMKVTEEDPGIAAIQLEQFLAKAKLRTDHFKPNELNILHENGQKYKLRLRTKEQELVFGNELDQGYMPLFYHVLTANFSYKEPLLTFTARFKGQPKRTYHYLIKPVKDTNQKKKPPNNKSKQQLQLKKDTNNEK